MGSEDPQADREGDGFKDALPGSELADLLERGRALGSTYVLCGALETQAAIQVLTIEIAAVADGSLFWSKSFPVAGADPAKIASEANATFPAPDDD